MPYARFLTASALLLALAACSPEAAPADDAEATEPNASTQAAAAGEASPQSDDEETLDPTEILARDVCAIGDEGFGDILPEGYGFAARGPDARVHTAWNLDGEVGEVITYTPDLEMEPRTQFDAEVAEFLRHNLVAGFDRAGITGAFRYRDGRFCVIQTERVVVEALRDAVTAVQ